MCISVSYMLILKIVLCIASHKGHLKFLNPCISHICSVLIFCVPIVTLSIIYQFTKNVFSVIRIIIADIFLLVPLLMQPTMYTVKNQQIRNFIFVKLCEKQSWWEILAITNAQLIWQFLSKCRDQRMTMK